jgi:hypothetical protein
MLMQESECVRGIDFTPISTISRFDCVNCPDGVLLFIFYFSNISI